MKEYKQNQSYESIKTEGETPESEKVELTVEGKGNRYSLPFGLCKGVGIDTTGMTPREAWDAYTNKTGISKEQAEKEHWGKEETANKMESVIKTEAASKTTQGVKWKKGDIVESNGLKVKILDVDENNRTLGEVLEGKRGTKAPGKKFLFTENSPMAQGISIVNKQQPETQSERQKFQSNYPTVEGVSVQENAEQMRVQLRFDGKPDEETRTLLKSYGFRWSPSQNAWQRQLTGNGKYAAKQVMQKLSGKGE